MPSPADVRLTTFTLSDQFGTARTVVFDAELATVLVIAERSGVGAAAEWTRRLRAALGERVSLIGIASLIGVPRFARGTVRLFLRAAPSVLLDWNGEIAKRCGPVGSGCLVLAVDGEGKVRERRIGPWSDAALTAIERALDDISQR